MREFVHERQRTPHDCVICSLAMFLRRPYEQVLSRLTDLCSHTNITWTPDEAVPASLMRLAAIEFRRTIVTMQEVPPNAPAMLTMASNRPDWLHVVFMDTDMTIFDPIIGVDPTPYDPVAHQYAEAHVGLRYLAPWVLRECEGSAVASWPEIEVRASRAHRAMHG